MQGTVVADAVNLAARLEGLTRIYGSSAILSELTKADFEAGIGLYYDRKFAESSVKFNQVLQGNPQDKAARIYLERCARYMVKGVPEDWTGVEALTKK